MRYLLFLLGLVILSSCNLEGVIKTASQPSATETSKTASSEPTKSSPVMLSNRIALVIGNAAYAEKPLVNPVNDANDMAEVLKNLGFDVTLKTDVPDLTTMVYIVRDFVNRLSNKSVSVFYFSGHGNQYNGHNYLMPLQAKINEEEDFPRQSLRVSEILDKMKDNNREGINLVFLDACRSNLFGGKRFKSGNASKGLISMGNYASGSLIAYAAAPGEVAEDYSSSVGGKNSTYTKHLLLALREMSRKNITTLLTEVRKNVYEETDRKQLPANEDYLLVSDFCLALDGCESTTPPAVAVTPIPSEKLSISSSLHAIVIADQAEKKLILNRI